MEEPVAPKAYHAKRPHRKSRAGCRTCKSRKVKCDEAKPACRNCVLRKEQCVYPLQPSSNPPPTITTLAPQSKPPQTFPSSSDSSSSSPSPPPAVIGPVSPFGYTFNETDPLPLEITQHDSPPSPTLLQEPLFMLHGQSSRDVALISHYLSTTYSSISHTWPGPGCDPALDRLLRVTLLQEALASPFLMDGLLGLTAMHLSTISPAAIPATQTTLYRARALAGYRTAITTATPQTLPALLVSSLLQCGLSSAMLRGPEAQPLFIFDWILVWRGIGLIIQMAKRMRNTNELPSGLNVLFSRPVCDLDASAEHIPSNLLFMVASIKPGDADYGYKEAYYEALRYLGTLYKELREEGFGLTLDLRIITFFTWLSGDFVEAARKRRKRAGVVVAYYLVFLKMLRKVWWMRGISDPEIGNINRLCGNEWEALIRVPLAAVGLERGEDLKRLLLENHPWGEDEAGTGGDGTELVLGQTRLYNRPEWITDPMKGQ
ncbi:hypothetical protein OQA88_12234 [Cercophora sp. LCS_1]